jgi:hypothetical protein
MPPAGMTISRKATMLTAMPRTKKAGAANTTVVNDRDRCGDPRTPSGHDNSLSIALDDDQRNLLLREWRQ